MKSIVGWENQNSTTNNLSGFTSLPSGYRIHGASTHNFTEYLWQGTLALFWTNSVEDNDGTDLVWYMSHRNIDGVSWIAKNVTKTCGLSIRCIKNMDENIED